MIDEDKLTILSVQQKINQGMFVCLFVLHIYRKQKAWHYKLAQITHVTAKYTSITILQNIFQGQFFLFCFLFFLLKLKYNDVHQYNSGYNRWQRLTPVIKKMGHVRKKLPVGAVVSSFCFSFRKVSR